MMYTTTYSTGIENILNMFQKVSYTHQNRTSSKTDTKISYEKYKNWENEKFFFKIWCPIGIVYLYL